MGEGGGSRETVGWEIGESTPCPPPLYCDVLNTFLLFQSPLSHACVGRILPIVDMLSEVEGVDVNTVDKEGNTPLIFSSQAGKLQFKRATRLSYCFSLAG